MVSQEIEEQTGYAEHREGDEAGKAHVMWQGTSAMVNVCNKSVQVKAEIDNDDVQSQDMT